MKIQLYIVSLLILFLSSCVSGMFYEKLDLSLKIERDYKTEKAYYNGSRIIKTASGRVGTAGLEIEGGFNIDVEKEGYKSKHLVLRKTRWNGYTLVSVLVPYLLPFELISNRNWTFPKEFDIGTLTPIPTIEKGESNFYYRSVEQSDSISFDEVKFYSNSPRNNEFTSEKSRKFPSQLTMIGKNRLDEEFLIDEMFLMLDQINSSDSDDHFYNPGLDLNVFTEINDIEIHYVKAKEAKRNWYKIKITTLTDVVSPKGDTVYTKLHEIFSGEFTTEIPVEYAVSDALQSICIDIINSVKPMTFESLDKAYELDLMKSETIGVGLSKDQFEDHIFKVKVGKESYGIALPIKEDGILVTSYESIFNNDNNWIYNVSGDSLEFEVISVIPGLELAFLKVNSTFSSCFRLREGGLIDNEMAYNVIGFLDEYDELYRGVVNVSAIRNTGEINVLQMDKSFSFLNSPALVTEDGVFLGFVSLDIQNYSYSGISFCMPAFELNSP